MSRPLLAPRWLAFHALALSLVVVFLRLGWWQLSRAQAGNPLSVGYAFEWPAFAVFTGAVWAWLCRDATGSRGPGRLCASGPDRVPDELALGTAVSGALPAPGPDDPELAAYNRMLAELASRPRR